MEKSQLPNKKIPIKKLPQVDEGLFFWFHLINLVKILRVPKSTKKRWVWMRRRREGVGSFRQIRVGKTNDQVVVFFFKDLMFTSEKNQENPSISAFVIWITMLHVAKSVGWGCFFVKGNLGKIMECVLIMLLLEPEKLTKRKLEGKKSTVTRVFGRTQPISYLYPTESLGGGFSNIFGCFHCNPLGGKWSNLSCAYFSSVWLKPPTHSFNVLTLKNQNHHQNNNHNHNHHQNNNHHNNNLRAFWDGLFLFLSLWFLYGWWEHSFSLGDACIESCKALPRASQQKNCWLWVSRKARRLDPQSLT